MKLTYCFGDRLVGKSHLMALFYGATHTLLHSKGVIRNENYRWKMTFDEYEKLEEEKRPKKIIIDDEKSCNLNKVLNRYTQELIAIYNNLDALDYIIRQVKMNNYEKASTYTSSLGKIHILHFWCLIN